MKNKIIIFLILTSFSGFGQGIYRTLPNVTNTADSMKPVSKAQATINTSLQSSIATNATNIATNVTAITTKLQTITSISDLRAYVNSSYAYFDGSTWVLTTGNFYDNYNIVRVSATSYWQRILNSNIDNRKIVITGWGDSMTQGANAQVPYTSYFFGLSGYTVDMQGVGGETSTQIRTRMIAANTKYANSVIIWAGRNNSNDKVTVLSDIATMVSALGHNRYLIVGITNGASEGTGTTALNQILDLNATLQGIYNDKFIDIRAYLLTQGTGTGQDLTDINNNVVPLSLRSDVLHLTSAANQIVANFFYQKISYLLNDKDNIVRNSGINNVLANPSIIGSGVQNSGFFNDIKVGFDNKLTVFTPSTSSFLQNLVIGTNYNSSATKLHIEGDMYATGKAYFVGENPGVIIRGDANGLFFQNSASGTKHTIESGLADLKFANYTATGSTIFTVNSLERMRILSSGFIGIGKYNPAYELDVVGNINASSSVKVNGVNVVLPNAPSTFTTYNVFQNQLYISGHNAPIVIDRDQSNLTFRNTSGSTTKQSIVSNLTDFSIENYTSTGALFFRTNNITGLHINASQSVGIGTTNQNASAVLDITSTTRGVLLPRMTTTQRDTITTPSEGLEVYNLTTHAKEFYNGTVWKTIVTN